MIAERLTAQLLAAPASTPEAVVERLLVVQAQDARGARLAVRSRTRGLRAADVDRALTERRSMVVTWLNRGTLHLVRADDYWWLHPITAPQAATANLRRLRQEGVSVAQAERGVEVVYEAVHADGPQTRADLRRRLDAAGVPTAGQALVHVLFAASLRGLVVRGPMRGSEPCFVSVTQWLGDPPAPLPKAEALARLARRYLAGHGPADPRDLAKWAGLTLADARGAFVAITDDVVGVPDGLFDLAGRTRPEALPAPRLLGPFDPLLLGWASREPFVRAHTVVTTNGIFRACALVEGHVVGIWGLRDATLRVSLLEKVKSRGVDALRRDAADVLRYLALPADSDVVIEAA